ncbi:hypothetical protein DRO66_05930 [Candidatus Bathyarchaeota archaeon]|nr:MAG: hypothetical protein DRO66_05930 [Candidatus Bathyarchaeota archaeon]
MKRFKKFIGTLKFIATLNLIFGSLNLACASMMFEEIPILAAMNVIVGVVNLSIFTYEVLNNEH